MAKTYFTEGYSYLHKEEKKEPRLLTKESQTPIWIPILMFVLAVVILIFLSIVSYDSAAILEIILSPYKV